MKFVNFLLVFITFLTINISCNKKGSLIEKKDIKTNVNESTGVPTLKKTATPTSSPTPIVTPIFIVDESLVVNKFCGSPTECELIQKTNDVRVQNSVSVLGVYPPCVLMAQDHAQYLANGGEFSHDRPNETFEERSKRFGCFGGENIAYLASNVDIVLGLWMNSEGHRENIISPSFQSMGAGKNNRYWVQCFSYEQGKMLAESEDNFNKSKIINKEQ